MLKQALCRTLQLVRRSRAGHAGASPKISIVALLPVTQHWEGDFMRCLYVVSVLTVSIVFRSSAYDPHSIDTTLHATGVEEITFRSGQFEIVGNLYEPLSVTSPHPSVIWVSGSGPSFRRVTSKETVKLMNCFLDRGFAYFRIDKPGSGDSKGKIHDDSVFAQLSDIVVSAVMKLKTRTMIRKDAIGIFGSSQAGYIMPLAVTKCPDITFMIGSSCPGENSIDQWNYLLEKQMICEGVPEQKARKAGEMFAILRTAVRKSEFDSAIAYFEKSPLVINSVGYDSSFVSGARSWWPRTIDLSDEAHYNPITLVEHIHTPIFLVYGSHDKQIDPLQAINAYTIALKRAGNNLARIVLLKESDHNMSLSSGCLNDINDLSRTGQYRLDPEYLKTIGSWIDELNLMYRLR